VRSLKRLYNFWATGECAFYKRRPDREQGASQADATCSGVPASHLAKVLIWHWASKMTQKNRDSHCKGRNKSGKPCGAAATAGGLCYFHSNPNKASELGRIGGRSKRRAVVDGVDPLPKLETATAVRDAIAQLIADVYAGKLQPRIAAGPGTSHELAIARDRGSRRRCPPRKDRETIG
jgi:hypothetical protein